jgi:hypothetical protein
LAREDGTAKNLPGREVSENHSRRESVAGTMPARIALEDWQQALVEEAPWGLLRGLIRSVGSTFINQTGRYSDFSYHFSNRSKDIIGLFTAACRQLGVAYRLTCWRRLWNVRINRRQSVEVMMASVGIKS